MNSITNNGRTLRSAKKNKIIMATLFLFPTFFVLIAFSYYPVINAISTSFTKWDGFYDPDFIGLKNYERLFKDQIFRTSMINVALWSAGSITVSLIAPYIGAELSFSLHSKRKQYIYRSLLVLPMVVPQVVTIQIWKFIYNPNIGVLNTLFDSIGLSGLKQNWLGDPKLVIPSLVFMGFPWISSLNFLLFYAGLQNIPTDIIEYSRLDGCSTLRRIFVIDIPLTLNQVKLTLILGIIGNLQNVTTPLLMTGGGPGYSSYVPGLYMYHEAFQRSRFGYATAIATVLFITTLILTLISNRIKTLEW